MSRPILPFPPSYSGSQQLFHLPPQPDPPPPPPSKPTYAKRGRITIVACLPCRKLKAKCDGKRPACSQCLRRDRQCQYNMTDEQRRLTFLRENVEHLEREKRELESLLLTLQRSGEDNAAEVMRILRTSNDLQAIARHAHTGRLLSILPDTNPPQNARPSPQRGQHQGLIRTIASAAPMELDEIVRRLRLGEDPASILASVTAGTLLQDLPSRDQVSTPGMEAEFSGREQFGLVKGDGVGGPQEARRQSDTLSQPISRWSSVTDDNEWIEHLLSLYFTWQHQLFQNFPEPLFRADMASGRTDYCSRSLVNTICAAGCLLSNSRRARRDPNDPRTAGLDFYEEAVRLLNNERLSTLPTTSALSILCHVESNFGHLSLQWQYSGWSSRMALDLNLHLRSNKTSTDQSSTEANFEGTARAHVFWGCFISDQYVRPAVCLNRVSIIPRGCSLFLSAERILYPTDYYHPREKLTSFTLGRLPLIPTNAITVDVPPLEPNQDNEEWVAFGVDQPRKSASSTTFRQIISLSKIVNSTLQMFFAPSRAISGSLLLEEYNKYLQWFAQLPVAVVSVDNAPPHILSLHLCSRRREFRWRLLDMKKISLGSLLVFLVRQQLFDEADKYKARIHGTYVPLVQLCVLGITNTFPSMYYHAAVLLLFRPFLKARFTESNLSPGDVCRQSANSISGIFAQHRQQYGLSGIFAFQLYCLLTACTIYIIRLPSISATSHLAAACNSFQDLTEQSECATSSLNIIRSLVQRWKIVLPLEVEAALYRDQNALAAPDSGAAASSDMDFSNSSSADCGTPPYPAFNSLGSRLEKCEAHFLNPPPPEVMQKRHLLAPRQAHKEGLRDINDYLFTPVPNQSAPLLGPIHTSTSHNGGREGGGGDTMRNDELNKAPQGFDGLNFVGDDGFDPFMGYQGD